MCGGSIRTFLESPVYEEKHKKNEEERKKNEDESEKNEGKRKKNEDERKKKEEKMKRFGTERRQARHFKIESESKRKPLKM